MEVGIITHYDVHNHGALLQLNALCKVLEELGYEAAALQFDKNYDFLGIDSKKKYNITLRSIPFYLKYLLQNGLRRTLYNVQKKRLLDRFKAQEQIIGEYYTSYKSLNAVVVGSDEVFALHTGPTPVLWGYALPSENIFSYAGCFGPTTEKDIIEKHCEAFVKAGLDSMKALSVRDKNSYEIIKALIGKESVRVCDPVLLYGYQKELNTIPRVHGKPYLLVYAYDNNMNDEKEVAIIKKYAKETGLRVVSAGFYHDWCDININTDPVTLLSYFRDAQYVVTDTFHGAVMSILTNSEFVVKIRGNANKLGNLLEEYLLTDRIITESDSLKSILSRKIQWGLVNDEIRNRREFSRKFISDNLNQ